jgi:hypothetical protein
MSASLTTTSHLKTGRHLYKTFFLDNAQCLWTPLWSSGQSSWLQIQKSRRYQIFWEVVSLERGPLSLVRIIEELLEWSTMSIATSCDRMVYQINVPLGSMWNVTNPAIHRCWRSCRVITGSTSPRKAIRCTVSSLSFKVWLNAQCLTKHGLQLRFFFYLRIGKSEASPKHYDVIRAAVMKSSAFWDTTPWRPLKVNRRFRGTCTLHLERWRVSQGETSLACSLTKKMEVICYSETSVDFQRIKRYYIPEHKYFQILLLPETNCFIYRNHESRNLSVIF